MCFDTAGPSTGQIAGIFGILEQKFGRESLSQAWKPLTIIMEWIISEV